MKTSFKALLAISAAALLAISAAALLAACGGGGSAIDTTTPPASQPEWASPAMFVPAGQSQMNVAVSGCNANVGRVSVPVTSPSFVINSAGDVIFSGVLAPSTAVAELVRVTLADATVFRSIELSSMPGNNSLYVESAAGDIGFTEGQDVNGMSSNNLRVRNLRTGSNGQSTGQNISCGMVADLTPAYAPSDARLAAKFTAGATGWRNTSNSNATVTFVNNQFAWDNQDSSTLLSANQTSVRYAGLNVVTGALSVGPSSVQVTQSVALSAAAASGGRYKESFYQDRNSPQSFIKGASLSITTSSQGVLEFAMEAADNVIFVTPKLGQDPNL